MLFRASESLKIITFHVQLDILDYDVCRRVILRPKTRFSSGSKCQKSLKIAKNPQNLKDLCNFVNFHLVQVVQNVHRITPLDPNPSRRPWWISGPGFYHVRVGENWSGFCLILSKIGHFRGYFKLDIQKITKTLIKKRTCFHPPGPVFARTWYSHSPRCVFFHSSGWKNVFWLTPFTCATFFVRLGTIIVNFKGKFLRWINICWLSVCWLANLG